MLLTINLSQVEIEEVVLRVDGVVVRSDRLLLNGLPAVKVSAYLLSLDLVKDKHASS